MSLRIGILSVAHVHTPAYVHVLKSSNEASIVGVWDHDKPRGSHFANEYGLRAFDNLEDLLASTDAVIICSENALHKKYSLAAFEAGNHVLCEKPLATTEEDALEMIEAAQASGKVLITAFPCRFSPVWQRFKERIKAGEIGTLRALNTTNRGQCPGGWFTQKELSGGGAMIDHTVHVADLLYDLLEQEPEKVVAQVGSNMHGKEWEDTAILTLEYPDTVFATLDSSWSYPPSHHTWGDVMITAVGDQGVLELDLFGQEVHVYQTSHKTAGFGSHLDAAMVASFISAVLHKTPVVTTGEAGLRALRVALKGYQSLATVTA